MHRRMSAAALLLSLAAVASLAACSTGEPGAGQSGSQSGGAAATFAVASGVDLAGSSTYDAAKRRGSIRVGVKEDQPGLGYRDAVTGERTGFDIQIATWIAAELGFSADRIEFDAIPSANREQALVNGDIDYYVGTYSITDKRKQMIGFAGPYFVTGQGLLVKKGNPAGIHSDRDLAGKTVCSATGSTPIQNIRDNYPDTKPVEFDTYSQCVEALRDGRADAVTTDEAILIGYAAQDPDSLEVVGKPFTTERYGVGVPKDDAALRHFINGVFADGSDTWQRIYDATLGESGVRGSQPKVDDYS